MISGGGMWGCSVAYHLARLGRRDTALVEQTEIAGQKGGSAPLRGRKACPDEPS